MWIRAAECCRALPGRTAEGGCLHASMQKLRGPVV